MEIPQGYPFGALLRQFRARAHLSQEALAGLVGVHRKTIVAWEQGTSLPKSRPNIQALAEALWLNDAEAETFLRAGSYPQTVPPREAGVIGLDAAHMQIWQVPYGRPPCFTGREALLEYLEQTLRPGPPAIRPVIIALSGLGGVGKTTLALEYAYRSRSAYQAILWAGAETRTTLTSSLLTFAATLDLPEQRGADQQQILDAVQRWLGLRAGWLLILDNVQDFSLLGEVLPPDHAGQVLLTTQLRATGVVAPGLVVEPLTEEEGAVLLLRRSRLVGFAGGLSAVPPAEQAIAGQLADQLGGLPLALDQAGAYLEETGCGLEDYQALYQRHQAALLARRGGASTHPEPVTTTFALAFAQVQASSPAAADLLRLCAYLAPEAIPENLITGGGTDLPETLQTLVADELGWQETCAVALRSSLLARHWETRTLSLHRLVQVVLQDALGAAQRAWAERVVRLVQRAFPRRVEYDTWGSCQRLLPQALACAGLIAQRCFIFPEAAHLLAQAGDYLRQRGSYGDALPLVERALAIREQALGPAHPDVAESLNQLAVLYYHRGQYDHALPLLERALDLREQVLGASHPAVAICLSNLAEIYREQEQYDQSLTLFQRAHTAFEQTLGPTHPLVAGNLDGLAALYSNQGQYDQARKLFEQALAIDERTVGPIHPYVAADLDNLAALHQAQGHYPQAMSLYEQALVMREQTLGPAHPDTAVSLSNLAELCREQRQFEKAQPLFERALLIYEVALEPSHPRVARCVEQYAALQQVMQQPTQAGVLEGRVRASSNSHLPA